MIKGKKGQNVMDGLGKLGIGIAVLAVVLVVTFLIMSQVRTQIITLEGINTNDTSTFTSAYNGTNTLTNAVEDIPGWVPIIVITAIGALLLGMVAMFRR